MNETTMKRPCPISNIRLIYKIRKLDQTQVRGLQISSNSIHMSMCTVLFSEIELLPASLAPAGKASLFLVLAFFAVRPSGPKKSSKLNF